MRLSLIVSSIFHATAILGLSWSAAKTLETDPEDFIIVDVVVEELETEELVEQTAEQNPLPERERAAINPAQFQQEDSVVAALPEPPVPEAAPERLEVDETPEPDEPLPEPETSEPVDTVEPIEDQQPVEETVKPEPALVPTPVMRVDRKPDPEPNEQRETVADDRTEVTAVPMMKPRLQSPKEERTETAEVEKSVEDEAAIQDEEAKPIDLAAFLKSVENLDKRVQSDKRLESTGERKTEHVASSISDNELQRAILEQVGRCWTMPSGLGTNGNVNPRLRIEFEPDGRAREVTVIDEIRMANDPLFRTVAESAQRAVLRCRLELPREEFQRWQRVTMNFYPGAIN
jgi:outer membrane biosynthesis protein TonB